MKIKIPALVLCLILILSSFTACGNSGEDAKIVTPIDTEPQYLDPQIVSDKGAKNIILNCFEGLVTYGGEAGIIPAAAESFDVSADGLTYTFKLRQDGAWLLTNAAKRTLGEEKAETFDTRVLAKDFVFAFQRALKSETLCPYADSLMNIKNASKVNRGELSAKELGVKAEDDYTLVITLERKDADFLDVLTMPSCMPCNREFFDLTKGRYGLSTEYLIYNGPFYISNIAEHTAISCRRNRSYHSLGDNVSGEVKPTSIYYSFNSEQATRAEKLKGETYSLAPLTEQQKNEFTDDKHIKVKSFDSAVTSIIFNCKDEITSLKDIRKALALAVDTSIFLEKFGKQSALGIVPSSATVGQAFLRSRASNAKALKQNKKQAVSLLKSGMEKLDIKDIELTILCETENENAVRVAMQSWQSVFGVKFGISVEAVDYEELQKRVSQGNFQMALYDLSFTDTTAKAAVSRFASENRNNIISLSDKKYDEIIDRLSKAAGTTKTIGLITEAEKYLVSNCCIIPLCETQTHYGLGKGFENVIFSPTGEVAYYKTATQK